MIFMLITNKPDIASYAEKCGVSRIFIDLERIGKKDRQGHMDTVISDHLFEDISSVKDKLVSANLLVRLNPLHRNSGVEIDEAIARGADCLMLPMFKNAIELASFCRLVRGRIPVIPLVETISAFKDFKNIVRVEGLGEVYIGLNDLHIEMGLDFMFEPVAAGLLDKVAEMANNANLPFGFGGVARIGEGAIPGDAVLSEHLRLGSRSVILSRSFHKSNGTLESLKNNIDLAYEISRLRASILRLSHRSTAEIDSDRKTFIAKVHNIVTSKKESTAPIIERP